jgi:hypothetical protein
MAVARPPHSGKAKRASSGNDDHGWSKQRKESSRKEWRERGSAEICTWIEMYSYKNEWTRDNVGGQGRRGPMHPDVSARGGLPLGMASDFFALSNVPSGVLPFFISLA